MNAEAARRRPRGTSGRRPYRYSKPSGLQVVETAAGVTALQDAQRATFAALDNARERLDDDSYQAFVEIVRLTLGEALRVRRDAQP